jgi:hypothetical protein
MPPINTNLLVMADMLQDYIVDKTTGDPLSGGIITFYQDTARTVLKNIYYQVGTPSNYSYIAFPNPLELSASGTFQDNNGNDVIPFYYPYDENSPQTPIVQPYYVTVYSSNSDGTPAVLQFTRENFPLVITSPVDLQNETNRNYIINKEYWRNIGSQTISALTTTLAPSQHEGFSMPDVQFVKNTTDATDIVSFNTFVPPSSAPTFRDQILIGDTTPEFYLNLNCTAPGSETSKVLQFPLSFHIKSLSGAAGTITFQGMNVGGNANNTVSVSVLQFLGTGGNVPIVMTYQTFALTNQWTKFAVQVILPSAQNLITSVTGDDALYVQFGFPTAMTCDINIAMPSFYLGTIPATNDFDTYDQINSITGSPRTGDFRISLNSFSPYGWVPANDGTLGTSTSGATTRANIDTWPLYSLLWNNFPQSAAPVTGGRGASAFADWSANKPIQLTLTLGRVIAGTQPGSGVSGQAFGSSTQTLAIANLPAHNHPGSTVLLGLSAASSGVDFTAYSTTTPAPQALVTVASQGSGAAFSIQQQSVFQNIFIKL